MKTTTALGSALTLVFAWTTVSATEIQPVDKSASTKATATTSKNTGAEIKVVQIELPIAAPATKDSVGKSRSKLSCEVQNPVAPSSNGVASRVTALDSGRAALLSPETVAALRNQRHRSASLNFAQRSTTTPNIPTYQPPSSPIALRDREVSAAQLEATRRRLALGELPVPVVRHTDLERSRTPSARAAARAPAGSTAAQRNAAAATQRAPTQRPTTQQRNCAPRRG
jgi:hypothetical protein